MISFLKRLKPFIWTPAGWSGPSEVRGEGGHNSHKQMVSAISSSQVFLDRPAVKELFFHSSWKPNLLDDTHCLMSNILSPDRWRLGDACLLELLEVVSSTQMSSICDFTNRFHKKIEFFHPPLRVKGLRLRGLMLWGYKNVLIRPEFLNVCVKGVILCRQVWVSLATTRDLKIFLKVTYYTTRWKCD